MMHRCIKSFFHQ